MSLESQLEQAAAMVAAADSFVFAAGAGMGVDSGLPDFRGDHGFWKAYPPYARLGLRFADVANPQWFASDPTLAWGFYGHRLNLYRSASPHDGFRILRRWADRAANGAFVFTSNVDGQFQRAGFDPNRIVEVHGTIDWMQCMRSCGAGLFEVPSTQGAPLAIDENTMRATGELPACPKCGGLARPNILMFGDFGWDSTRTAEQQTRLRAWLRMVRGPRLVVIECGAGLAIPTVRHFCEHVASSRNATLIRINPREPDVPAVQLSLELGALAALRALEERLPL
jgi:NAD-dependent SIR2 family protein deacetylase